MNKNKSLVRKMIKSIGLVPVFALVFLFFLTTPQKAEAALNNSRVIEDGPFAAAGTMNEGQIQVFLASKGSYLTNYYETRSNLIGYPERYQAQGKSAAHIIWWVANEYGLNPQVIITTLQKEQTLITNSNLNQYGLDFAMGYGCFEGPGCQDGNLYQGFSRQVDWGSWQLKANMDWANTHHPNAGQYWTGNTIGIDGQAIYLGNGATASLYRYTPHIQTNFYNIYTSWFDPVLSYDYWINSAVNPPSAMSAAGTAFVQVHLRNTGSNTWYNESNAHPMRLAVLNADGKTFWPNNDTWVGNDRVAMTSSSVAPGQIGSFNFTMKAPLVPGYHTLRFMPVVEGVQALKDIGMQFSTTISYDYWINSAVNPPATMTAGSTAFVQVHLRNTGLSTWYNEAQYNASPSTRRPMRLAIINADGQNFFPNNDTWVDNVRITMTSPTVAPGQIGSFNFTIKAPVTPGYHRLRFIPVVEGVQALKDIGMQFGVTSQ